MSKDTVQFTRKRRGKIHTLTVIRLTDDGYYSRALGKDSEYVVMSTVGAPADDARVAEAPVILDLDDDKIDIGGDYEIAHPRDVPASVIEAILGWATKTIPVTRTFER